MPPCPGLSPSLMDLLTVRAAWWFRGRVVTSVLDRDRVSSDVLTVLSSSCVHVAAPDYTNGGRVQLWGPAGLSLYGPPLACHARDG
jgi:hypothetical protein